MGTELQSDRGKACATIGYHTIVTQAFLIHIFYNYP